MAAFILGQPLLHCKKLECIIINTSPLFLAQEEIQKGCIYG